MVCFLLIVYLGHNWHWDSQESSWFILVLQQMQRGPSADKASPTEQRSELSVTGYTGGCSGDTRLSVLDCRSALLLLILVSICYLDGNHVQAET